LDKTIGDGPILEEGNLLRHFKAMEENTDVYENYVITDDGSVVGYMSLLFYRSLFHAEGTAQINELVVDGKHRNKGYGKALLQFGIQRAKDRSMDEIEIGVEKENLAALEFYKRNGIEEEYVLLGMEL
jgi:ribosomal protein S18 acetylase RimI-like enzyme